MKAIGELADWVGRFRFELERLEWLGSSVVKSTIWLGLALLLLAAARRRSAAFRHVLGLAAALGIPVIFVLNLSPIPAAAGWNPWRQPNAIPSLEAVETAAGGALGSNLLSVDLPRDIPIPPSSWLASARNLALPCWIAGAASGCFLIMLSFLRKSCPLGAEWVRCSSLSIHRLLRAECRRFGVKRLPQVWLVRGSMPCVYGIVRPRLLLPPECLTWTRSRMRDVLRHETAHLARRDLPWQAFVRMALLPAWFHPLSWMLRRCLDISREEACDDAVLRAGSPGPEYAGHLLALAGNSLRCRRRHQVLAAPASAVGRRIRRILQVTEVNRNSARPVVSYATGCAALSGAAALGLLFGCETTQPVKKACRYLSSVPGS